MALDGIYISGYFTDDDNTMLKQYEDELRSKGVPLHIRNLSGTIMQASFDFVDVEVIAIAYSVLQQFIINGGYDITKYFLKKLWFNITKDRESNIPFTISIEGIPTTNGAETIKCKTLGKISDEDKDKILEKTFDLASQIENHQYQLMNKNQFYNALNGHVFKYDNNDESLHEVDVEKELRKRSDNK